MRHWLRIGLVWTVLSISCVNAQTTINIHEAGLSKAYPGFEIAVYESFSDTMANHNGRLSAFSLITKDGSQINYLAYLAIQHGRLGVFIGTPEPCSDKEKDIPLGEAPAMILEHNGAPFWVGKVCDGRSYYLYPLGTSMDVLLNDFLTKEFVAFKYNYLLMFDTEGIRESIKLNFQ